MAEKEEATATACSLSSLKDLGTVQLWAQTALEYLVVEEVLLERLHEELSQMEGHTDIGIRNCQVAVGSRF